MPQQGVCTASLSSSAIRWNRLSNTRGVSPRICTQHRAIRCTMMDGRPGKPRMTGAIKLHDAPGKELVIKGYACILSAIACVCMVRPGLASPENV